MYLYQSRDELSHGVDLKTTAKYATKFGQLKETSANKTTLNFREGSGVSSLGQTVRFAEPGDTLKREDRNQYARYVEKLHGEK